MSKNEPASRSVRLISDRRPRRASDQRIDTATSRSVEFSPAMEAWLDLLADLIADDLLSERTSRE